MVQNNLLKRSDPFCAPICTGHPHYNKASTGRFVEFSSGQVKTAEKGVSRRHADADQIKPDSDEFKPMVPVEMFEQAQLKLAATKTREYAAPKTASLWLRGLVICAQFGKPMRGRSGTPTNRLKSGYVCSEYSRWATKAPSGCGHFQVEHELLESAVLDYLVEAATLKNTLKSTPQRDSRFGALA